MADPAPVDPAPTPTPADPAPAPAPAPSPAPADPAPAPADTPKAAEAPIDYGTLKFAEGYKADDPVFADAVKMFGDNKIAPDVAQKLMDFTVERDKAIAKAVNDSNAAGWQKQRDGWKAETAKTVSAEDLGHAKTAAEKLFEPQALKYLEGMGMLDYPGFVQAMVKISKAIKDDTFVTGNAGSNGVRDARSFYPNSNMNP